jgi:hypothetical protein
MSPNPDTSASPYRTPKLFLLLFRLELLVIVACIAAGGLAAAAILNDSVSPWIFAVAAAAGLGLCMGMLARAFYRSYSRPLQWAAGLAGTIAGLIVLGWLTRGLAGADPNGRMQFGPDWMALVQLLIGTIAATLAHAAGRIKYPAPPIVPSEVVGALGGSPTRPREKSRPAPCPKIPARFGNGSAGRCASSAKAIPTRRSGWWGSRSTSARTAWSRSQSGIRAGW